MNHIHLAKNLALHEKAVIQNKESYLGIASLDGQVDYIKRQRVIKEEKRFTQSFAKFWVLFRTHNFERGKVFGKFGDRFFEIHGSVYIYIPAFKVTEWCFHPGVYDYEFFCSFADADSCFPDYPVIFPYEKKLDIMGYDAIADLLKYCDLPDLSQRKKLSYVAEKAKSYLDTFFSEDISIAELANDINIAHTTMTPSFKEYYGITPVQYRNILRSFEAVRLLKNGESVTRAGFNAGFNNSTQYNQHFHRMFGVSPSAFSK